MSEEKDDPGMRNVDFFDDNTSDEGESELFGTVTNTANVSPQKSPTHKRNSSDGDITGQPVVRCGNGNGIEIKREPPPRPPRSPEISHLDAPVPRFVQTTAMKPQAAEVLGPISAEQLQRPPSPIKNNVVQRLSRIFEAPAPLTQQEQILSAHAITVDALLRTKTPNHSPTRSSGSNTLEAAEQAAATPRKTSSPRRVSILPPPIDTDKAKRSSQALAHSPYPFNIRKSFIRQSHISVSSTPREAILVLSLRRRANHRATKVSEIRIPANLDITPPQAEAGSTAQAQHTEKHFETIDFDDNHLFRSLRTTYASLAGPWRHLSARTLHRIGITHSDLCASPASCSHHMARSPLHLRAHGLADSFSEANLLRHFARPHLGKSQYAWVHFAYRIASTPLHQLPPAPIPENPAATLATPASEAFGASTPRSPAGDVEAADCVAGLEFVQGWAVGRIVGAVALVKLLAMLGVLLWVFLGVTAPLVQAGWGGAAERVVGGCLVGLLVLGLGWTTVGVWVFVSWSVD